MNALNYGTFFLFITGISWIIMSATVWIFKKLGMAGEESDAFSFNSKGAAKGMTFLSFMSLSGAFYIMLMLQSCVAFGDTDEGEFWFPIFVKFLLKSWGVI